MEQSVQSQQPILIQSGGSKSPANQAITYAFGGLFLVGAFWYGKKMWDAHLANKVSENLDTPEAQAASKIFAAKGFFHDDTNSLYDAARFIASNKLSWKAVAQSFQEAHQQNIEDFLQSFLNAGELKTFYDIFQYTTPSVVKPPPTAKLQYDTTKEYIVVKAVKDVNVRKSPKLSGTEVLIKYLNPISSSNVIALAKSGTILGYLTGKSFAGQNSDKTSAVLFYEVGFLTINDAKKTSFQNFWVAASQLDAAMRVAIKDKPKAYSFLLNSIKAGNGIVLIQSDIDNASS